MCIAFEVYGLGSVWQYLCDPRGFGHQIRNRVALCSSAVGAFGAMMTVLNNYVLDHAVGYDLEPVASDTALESICDV